MSGRGRRAARGGGAGWRGALAGLGFLAAVQAWGAAHSVREGETLSVIADRYGVSADAIVRANGLSNPDRLLVGQRLEIPEAAGPDVIYRIKRGDTLGGIAARFGVSPEALAAHNRISQPDRIQVGQALRIPSGGGTQTGLPEALRRELDRVRPAAGKWKSVIIHHTATSGGAPAGFERNHRRRNMENGLAYHFLIGNGNGMGDGEIYVGGRWEKQLDGGHTALERLNATGIGIALVGNFQTSRPTHRQLQSLEALLRYLTERTGLSADRVTTHRLAHPRHTACPGKNFPLERVVSGLR